MIAHIEARTAVENEVLSIGYYPRTYIYTGRGTVLNVREYAEMDRCLSSCDLESIIYTEWQNISFYNIEHKEETSLHLPVYLLDDY